MNSCSSESNDNISPLTLPKLIVGTSGLGNLYTDIGYEAKKDIIADVIAHCKKYNNQNLILDCAGKYGCGYVTLHMACVYVYSSVLDLFHTAYSQLYLTTKMFVVGWHWKPLA